MNRRQVFEQQVMPHLDAGYNLARWLLRDAQAADDALQEAAMRAFRYLDSLKGDEARPWLLGIVRNTCRTQLARQQNGPMLLEFDEAVFAAELRAPASGEPQQQLQRSRLQHEVDAAIRALSPPLREVIVLRELEELAYADIARIVDVPVGTVMSRLSRARGKLREVLAAHRMDPS
ncbi:sigma-70 family RNA polymerase sigma factor [Ideonella azotifigens]|uniref:Sigma-70 family RNA polymerase sigma factor n=1 Tax=Ideonella azotifigens TaxID=513160 RepID=A0ABN1JZR4_9BURK|nr:sigma-70 family RNA polymerase sigma factor [Ideonella azotifigens]MCD2342617.1 sigma-70 family RNA polymerase sigma factor [Ideonella azotifigens]